MEKTAITLLIIIFFVFLSSLTFGTDRGRRHGGSPGDEEDITTISELDLADRQVSQIRAIREAHLRDIKPFQDKMRAKRQELKAIWLQTVPNQDRIIVLQKEIGNLRELMYDTKSNYHWEIFKILTPEQQRMFETIGGQRRLNSGPR